MVAEENLKINICFITDRNYVLPTIVAITSVIQNNKNNILDIHVLCDDITKQQENDIQKLKTLNSNITIHNVNNQYKKIGTEHLYVSKSAMLKFTLADYFKNLDKILYLDSDIIVKRNLKEFWNTELQDVYASVSEDIPNFYYNKTHAQRLNLSKYFNSGVMLLNLNKMREDNISDKLLENKKNDKFRIFMDQDAFNTAFNENVIFIDKSWNYIYIKKKFDKSDISILHYAGGYKPWSSYNISLTWFKYYLLSPISYTKSLFLIEFPPLFFKSFYNELKNRFLYPTKIKLETNCNKIFKTVKLTYLMTKKIF